MTDTTRTAIYARSATSPNPEAVAEQIHACRVLAAEKGWVIAEVFVDEGISGGQNDRPGLNGLRDGMREGRFDAILTDDAARLFRERDLLDAFLMKPDRWASRRERPCQTPLDRSSGVTEFLNKLFAADKAG